MMLGNRSTGRQRIEKRIDLGEQFRVVAYRGLLWHAALPLKPPLHAVVSEIDGVAEHERAAPDDAVDTARVTLLHGFV